MFARSRKQIHNQEKLEIVDSAEKNDGVDNGPWTTVLHIILPLAALTLLWGRHGFVTRFFMQFKENYISAYQPYNKQSQLLNWIDYRLKFKWGPHAHKYANKVTDYWKNGSLLCSLINSAIPGACTNPYRHQNQRPTHGQDLAYKYLGIKPVFASAVLQNENLSTNQEYHFYNYIKSVQEFVDKVTQRKIQYSSRYAARGMGLITGEQNRLSTFYIYPMAAVTKGGVNVSICGPYGTHCKATALSGDLNCQTEMRRLAYVSRAQKMFFRSFSIDFGLNGEKEATINYIPIKISTELGRVKVEFIPQNVGVHEISITTNGFHLIGSPFIANILHSSEVTSDDFYSNYFIKQSHEDENQKQTKRRVISKIIDCIDEQITLYDIHSDINTNDQHAKIQTLDTQQPTKSQRLDGTQITAHPYRSIFPNNEVLQCETISVKNVSHEISPICERHIDHEVEMKPNKKLLKRQTWIELEDSYENLHLEKPMENNECVNHYPTYSGSYFSELNLPLSCAMHSLSTHSLSGISRDESSQNYERYSKSGTRFSLPNIHRNLDSSMFSHMRYKTKFKENKEYWTQMSLRTLSSSIISIASCISVTPNVAKYDNQFSESLPNLSSLRKRILNLSNTRTESLLDFYDDYQPDTFRNKFLECRNFWESIIRTSLNHSKEDSDFDSGYYASLPNISPDYKEQSRVISKQYKEKRQFWENLSLNNSKWVKSQIDASAAFEKESPGPGKSLYESNTIDEHEEELLLLEQSGENQTDDVKQMEVLRFTKARSFFRSLEKFGSS